MTPEFYKLNIENMGSIFLCPKPRGNDWLSDELSGFKKLEITHIVSMLTDSEIDELGLQNEGSICETLSLVFINLPIKDRRLPESFVQLLKSAEILKKALESRENIMIHCRAGIGRTTLMASLVLFLLGFSPSEAINIIEETRGVPVPDTEEQRNWILSLEEKLSYVSFLL